MNAIMVIHPYKHEGMWVFDDENVDLFREPFVSGADKIIDRMVENIANAYAGFNLLFSAQPFPNYQIKLEWRRTEYDGNWYYNADFDMEGWLCPALFKYFDEAPKEFYAQAQASP